MSQATLGSPSARTASAPPTLLHLPRAVLAFIASKLHLPRDRLRLEASCRTLLDASCGQLSRIYWGGPRLVFSFYSDDDVEDAAALLAARRPTVSGLNLETSSEIPYDAPLLPSPSRELLLPLSCRRASYQPSWIVMFDPALVIRTS